MTNRGIDGQYLKNSDENTLVECTERIDNMAQFQPGKVIKTDFGAPIKIEKFLAEGGQGEVYIVEYGGTKKALKWYKPNKLRDPDAFYDNLKNNADHGSPDKAFLWPDAVTERIDGSFGYIMDLRPDGYYELNKILASDKYNIASFKVVAEAAIRIVSAFRVLHSIGYSYQDLNAGNFFVNLQTGDVLICDNDNVAPNGTHTGILGTPRYMAPEIVTGDGKVMPDTWSDRFSLSVILFLLIFTSHPLEGKRWLVPCLTDPIARELYGSNPVFVLDENDTSNRPVKGIHENLQGAWPYMPDYLKDAFRNTFCQEALHNPQRRMTESDWLEVLTRFRSDIVICSCGNSVILKDTNVAVCEICGKQYPVPHELKLPKYSIAINKGTRIYRCQLGMCNVANALDPVGFVVANDQNKLYLKNMTSTTWSAVTPSGKVNQVAPGGTVPFVPGIEIKVFEKPIKMIK